MSEKEPVGKVWMRRVIALWFICVTSWVCLKVFADPSAITAQVNVAFATVITALTGIVAYWVKHGGKL